MQVYQPYPLPQPRIVRALYRALRRGDITRASFACALRYGVMGAWIANDPERE
jgi:hypothetical protein